MIRQNQDPMTLEYIWFDDEVPRIYSKTRVSDKAVHSLSQVPQWGFAGASDYDEHFIFPIADMNLKPVAMFGDPFSNNSDSKLILCETYAPDGKPPKSNKRNSCADIMERAAKYKPWFGIHQEYSLTSRDTHLPLGRLNRGYQPDCTYFAVNVFGRQIARQHLRFCDYAGIKIGGIKAEPILGLWEYQVGPCEGVEIGDQLWMSRYILERVAEDHNASVELKAKTNGRGVNSYYPFAHTYFSTVHTRAEGSGLLAINEAIEKLSKRHGEHVNAYQFSKRVFGIKKTAVVDAFTSGVGVRYVSVRIPDRVSKDGYGYFEDRRPPGDCDPYEVIKRLVETVCLDE